MQTSRPSFSISSSFFDSPLYRNTATDDAGVAAKHCSREWLFVPCFVMHNDHGREIHESDGIIR